MVPEEGKIPTSGQGEGRNEWGRLTHPHAIFENATLAGDSSRRVSNSSRGRLVGGAVEESLIF